VCPHKVLATPSRAAMVGLKDNQNILVAFGCKFTTIFLVNDENILYVGTFEHAFLQLQVDGNILLV